MGDARLQCLSYCLPMLLRVTFPLAGAHFVNQAARTVMAIVGPVLAVELGLSAVELGTLAACMFAAYAVHSCRWASRSTPSARGASRPR